MSSPIAQAIKQICEEKNLPYEAVIETIESALAAAYRKDFGNRLQNLKVNFEPETGEFEVFDVKTVVEDQELTEETAAEIKAAEEQARAERNRREEGRITPVESVQRLTAYVSEETPVEEAPEEKKFNPKTEVMLTDAKEKKEDAEVGDELRVKLEVPAAFGRMAAQTAKQVITQNLRAAERNVVFNEFKGREHELLNATVQRREGRMVLVDLGRTTAVMPPEEQVASERYNPGDRIKVYVTDVRMGARGPEVIVSRSHPEIVRQLFATEIPEVAAGIVLIKAIAREAGSRSKVAVASTQDNVDPIGACIGQRGTRIQTIIGELGGEKVDIILFDEDAVRFITNSLSPAKVVEIALDEDAHVAEVIVNEDQLSLAIGRGGQNVRLASRLTGWRLNIKELSEVSGQVLVPTEEGTEDGAEPSGEATEEATEAETAHEPEAAAEEAEKEE
ncbi:MAG: transcription termination factor NusA [Patescibacteria group bacterium]|nr:transcription termination factor NusA [Patescibacteria group bacterium]